MKSILQNEKECYVCKTTKGLHLHHGFFGPNRKISDKYGLVVWLCGKHHNLSNEGVHFNPELDRAIKQELQRKFEETHTREQFMAIIGRNYLDD